jgi:hypothetical protein
MERRNDYVETLKNALLSYALLKVYKSNELNLDYQSFTGDKLPAFSGCNLINACFTYIQPYADDKQDAINKFLDANLSSDKDIINLFDDFINEITPK